MSLDNDMLVAKAVSDTKNGNINWSASPPSIVIGLFAPLPQTTHAKNQYQSRSYEGTDGNKTTYKVTKQSPQSLPTLLRLHPMKTLVALLLGIVQAAVIDTPPVSLPLPDIYELEVDGRKIAGNKVKDLYDSVASAGAYRRFGRCISRIARQLSTANR